MTEMLDSVNTDASTPDELAVMEAQMRAEISALETKYGMSSEEFLHKWRAGEMPDTFETNYWAYALL
jgi:hypothetical protein